MTRDDVTDSDREDDQMERPMAAHDETTAAPSAPAEQPAGSDNVASTLGRLRAERDARLADQHLDLPVPSWNGRLVARYRLVSGDEMRRLTQRVGGGDRTVDARFLLLACEQVLMMLEDDGQLVGLQHDDGRPMGFDVELGALLGQSFERAAALLFYLFGDNEIAVSAQAFKVASWMQDTSQGVEGALVGEAPAGRTSS